jgi:UDP-2,3-diacylglucosamine pyrophosphatase LpxH
MEKRSSLDNEVEIKPVKVWAMSDIHSDHEENWEMLSSFVKEKHWDEERGIQKVQLTKDIIIIAGDISTKQSYLRETLKLFRNRFKNVFFVPGNNEMRLSKKEDSKITSSIEKFEKVLQICEELDVSTSPKSVHGVTIGNLLIL